MRTGSDITSSSTGATSHYNGLIDAVRWKVLYEPDIIKSGAADETLISSTADEVMYRYHYNAFNWLDSARFGVYNTATPAFTLKDAYKLWGDADNTAITYDDNGNIEKLKRSGYSGGDPGGLVMDELNYTYTGNTNKLASILDDAITSYTNDFDAATTKNFTYNAIGQMTASEAEDVQTVEYTPGGKVSKVVFTSTGDSVRYFYNDRGHKYKTRFTDVSAAKSTFQWYVTDAAGTIMAIYEKDEAVGGDTIKVTDQPVYADGRVAVMNRTDNDAVNFEITDHHGNVRVTLKEVADTTQITSWTDYYPFGSPMPGRSENLNTYRFNYQGQENAVSQQWKNFELRMYNSDLGRFNSPDPYGQFHSPYVGMGNSPVNGADPDGGYYVTDFTGSTHFKMPGTMSWMQQNLGWTSAQISNFYITGTPYSEQELRMQALAEYRQQEVAVLSRYGGDRVLARFAMRDLEDKYGPMLYSERQADMQANMAMAQAATQSARERADARFNATEGRFAQLAERSVARAAQEALRGRAAREADALAMHNAEYTGAFDGMDGSGKIYGYARAVEAESRKWEASQQLPPEIHVWGDLSTGFVPGAIHVTQFELMDKKTPSMFKTLEFNMHAHGDKAQIIDAKGNVHNIMGGEEFRYDEAGTLYLSDFKLKAGDIFTIRITGGGIAPTRFDYYISGVKQVGQSVIIIPPKPKFD